MLYCTVLCFCFKMSWLDKKQIKTFVQGLEYSLQLVTRLPWSPRCCFCSSARWSHPFKSRQWLSSKPLTRWWMFSRSPLPWEGSGCCLLQADRTWAQVMPCAAGGGGLVLRTFSHGVSEGCGCYWKHSLIHPFVAHLEKKYFFIVPEATYHWAYWSSELKSLPVYAACFVGLVCGPQQQESSSLLAQSRHVTDHWAQWSLLLVCQGLPWVCYQIGGDASACELHHGCCMCQKLWNTRRQSG